MRDAWITPHSVNEDEKRQEFILNTILCGLIPLLVIFDGYVARAMLREGLRYRGISFTAFTIIVIVFVYLLVLSRKGMYKIAAYVLIILYFLSTTYGAIHWGVELPLVAISYVLIIVISSIVISTRFGFFITALIAVTMTVISILQVHHIIQPLLYWKLNPVRINDPIQLSIAFFLITVVSWLSNREMEKSLVRARASEQALVAERNLLEIKVEERTKELKDTQQEKVSQLYRFAEFGRISTGVFHDMMNSLQGIVSTVGYLETTDEHLPEVKSQIQKAVAASKKMGSFIGSVRRQIKNDDALRTTFLLNKEISDAVDMLQFQARQASATISFAESETIEMHGNPVRFYQVILNLLINAIDACEDTDESLISIALSSNADRTEATIVVRDNGCGIAPEVIDHIFNSFFTTKHGQRGIGFGLSETKVIIEKEFSGTIAVSSEKDRGSAFTITIPITPYDNSLSDYSENTQRL